MSDYERLVIVLAVSAMCVGVLPHASFAQSPAPPQLTASSAAGTLRVEWKDERLTIVARQVPLASVLAEIARQTRIRVLDLEKVTGVVTVEIRSAPLFDAVQTLLSGFNYLIRYSATEESTERVHLWTHEPANAAAALRAAMNVKPVEAASVPTFVAPLAMKAEPFPTGPSPAEAEAARLQSQGLFNPDADEGSLLSLAKAGDTGVRIRALQTLALQNTQAGFRAINEALEDPNPFVRTEAIELVLHLSAPGLESARRLGDLLSHQDPSVRFSAAMALGEQSGTEAEFQLKRALDDDDLKEIVSKMLQQKERPRAKKFH